MAKLINYMSCVMLLLAASYTLYGSINQSLWDSNTYAAMSFISIFIYALVKFYKENVRSKSSLRCYAADNVDTIVRILALPFYTMQVLFALDLYPKGYMLAVIACLFGMYATFVSYDQSYVNSMVVYSCAITMAAASYMNQKIYCTLAGLLFAAAEYSATRNILPFKIKPYATFNYCLAGFTVLAYQGLTELQ